MIVAYPLQLSTAKFTGHFKLSVLHLQKGVENAQNWPKISLFKNFFETVLFGRVPPMQRFSNRYNSHTYSSFQLRAPSVKVASHVDHMFQSEDPKVTKNEQKLAIIDHNNTCAPRNPSDCLQINFIFEQQEKQLIQFRWVKYQLCMLHIIQVFS